MVAGNLIITNCELKGDRYTINDYRRFWEESFDRLDEYIKKIKTLKQKEKKMALKENKSNSSEFIISRIFDAPKELVFEMGADPEHLTTWIAPGGIKMIYKKANVQPGGISHYFMDTPGGKMWGKVTYREVKKSDLLVYVQSFSDENESITAHPMSPTWPREMLTTITFASVANKTNVTLTWVAINASPEEIATFEKAKDGMSQGWNGSFEQLEKYLFKKMIR
jgi:uncharacterized protein YndB with AHSA1/START domain